MTAGTVAAIILTDIILGKSNPWQEVYDPYRFKPIESAKIILSQVAEATRSFVGDRNSLPIWRHHKFPLEKVGLSK
ncbi:TPA: hypothetical protein HA338_11005 [Methanosarcina acetivorans]|uniref:Uncharacterized protein n=1 Tax=Methanosarcina acetivorans TaxID=2214 RepID=A0A832SHQ2_9EURY|nr:hypothetical protein [Methanosarcina acetivorans]HIH94524.1 hypothetical protein [Methanosarcina acetivorans]